MWGGVDNCKSKLKPKLGMSFCSSLFILFCFLHFRVLGLKLLVPLILIPPFSLLILFGCLIYFSEDWVGRIDYVFGLLLQFFVVSISYRSFLFIAVFISLFIGIKVMLTVSMMVGNFIDCYILGLVAVLISFIVYLYMFGFLVVGTLFLIFLSTLQLFLFILGILESFSSLFQSLTLSNRLSINMLCGSLLTSLLSLFLLSCGIYSILSESLLLLFLLMVFSFEIINSSIQLFIFLVLSFEYLMFLLIR